ncbi:MAG: hydrogenase expression/formation protein HypE [Saprospiraceae bacterium]|jgi:hydrogenase expression/formation protein HypE
MKMKLSCPMPKLDFDRITLAHGGGGTLTNQLLENGVFKLLENDLLDTHHDGAIFDFEGSMAFTTDSFVISPIFFPGGDIGELSVNGTVNDLAMCGARPKYLSLSFILEEGFLMEEFWKILLSIKRASEEAGVNIVTGDTKVVERGKGDKIYINTTGVGGILSNAKIDMRRVKEGDVVIVSDVIASHGIAIMSIREGLEFESDILSDTRPLHEVVESLILDFGSHVHLLKDPTRGGVASILNEIARDSKLGINLDEKLIPIEEQVKGACEMLGLDPLYVANEGIFIAIVDPEKADEVVAKLKLHRFCSRASIIGKVVSDHPRQVVIRSSIGGRRIVNMLVGQQLPRIC